ncbi:MAG: hypothetical protein H8Z69_01555 [Nanohaloarchaea archaeon]|nr:hypothetical protein [Candidatus Nanohaloarchaea archaeon]
MNPLNGNVGKVDEVAELLEENGYTVEATRAFLERRNEHPVYGETATEAVQGLLEDDDTSFSINMDVYPEGVTDKKGKVTIFYTPEKDYFDVQSVRPSNEIEDTQGLEHLAQTRPEQLGSENNRIVLNQIPEDAIFEMDRVDATIEILLMDAGYRVQVGNNYVDNPAVKDFP